MKTKEQIVIAIELAIADHKAFAGPSCIDYRFVECLQDAAEIVRSAPETAVPTALTKETP